MRAISVTSFGGPDALVWAEVPTPDAGPGEIRIQTLAVGVNRADVLQRQGFYPPPAGVSELIGLEAVGTVDQVGEGVSSWQVGDRVAALIAGGGYAEQIVLPAGQAMPLPAGVDPISVAGLIEVSATVVSNMDAARLRDGETFLVHGGAGGIGSFAIQYAKTLGCRVLATAGSASKLDHCRELGADDAFDYHGDWATEVGMATNDRGADVILDVVGAKYLEANVATLAYDGRLVIIGMQKGTKATLNIAMLLNKRGIIMATSLRGRPIEQKAAICRSVVERVWPLVTNGTIKVARETRIPLSQAVRAHELLESGDNIGKIILTVG